MTLKVRNKCSAWQKFEAVLKEVSDMRTELKRRCMVYQCYYKEEYATKYGLPLWAFYHMAYADFTIANMNNEKWVRSWWRKNRKQAEQEEKDDFVEWHSRAC